MSDVLLMEDMREELQRQVDAAGGIRAFARENGYNSHGCISLMLSGKRPVTEIIANKIKCMQVSAFRKNRG